MHKKLPQEPIQLYRDMRSSKTDLYTLYTYKTIFNVPKRSSLEDKTIFNVPKRSSLEEKTICNVTKCSSLEDKTICNVPICSSL